MKYSLILWCVYMMMATTSLANDRCSGSGLEVSELPQIFYKPGDTLIKWIDTGIRYEISTRTTPNFSARIDELEALYNIPLHQALRYSHSSIIATRPLLEFNDVKRWLALSDIHGQYELFVHLLRQHGVINDGLDWAFGDGHLVINGDILDRGDGVTESLWLVFKLQQQAQKQGGQVHYNIGNHELMVMNKDIRYINEKYQMTSEILDEPYDIQFSDLSFFGTWLRQQTILFKINNTGFVHAGISPDLLKMNLGPHDIHTLFRDHIFKTPKQSDNQPELLHFLTTTNGPIWYRGYFNDKNLSTADVDLGLQWWGVDRIVVGHTTQKLLHSLFEGRVIAIDANIKSGDTGEILIYDQGEYFRGLSDGTLLNLKNP